MNIVLIVGLTAKMANKIV